MPHSRSLRVYAFVSTDIGAQQQGHVATNQAILAASTPAGPDIILKSGPPRHDPRAGAAEPT